MEFIIELVFSGSVWGLIELAKLFGITYQEINVLLFLVIWPIITVIMAVAIVKLWRKNRSLNEQLA
tara:strand:+ start:79 stop:276 length:198 start_codon:yes stop_codon:yes gene_type:complete